MSTEIIEKTFTDFVSSVSKQVSFAVQKIVPHTEGIPVGLIERAEYRAMTQRPSEEPNRSQIFSVITSVIRCESSGETALIESGINFVRLSLGIQWEGPDACSLTRRLQDTFFRRLGRASSPGDANIPILRKEALKGYDVTFLFSSETMFSVESFLNSVLADWRQLTKELRLQQLIGHRRSGAFVFEKLINSVPQRENALDSTKRVREITESNQSGYEKEIDSVATEIGELGKLAEIDGMLEAELAQEDQFIIN